MKLELIATATFGLEAVVKREIEGLGYKILRSEDGKITFLGDESALVRANLWLRCADRVLLKQGEFEAREFEELFQQTKGIPWEQLIPPDGKFTVTGTSVKSTLHSVPACQSIVKKAVVERLGEYYGMEHFPETGASYTIKVTMLKDRATITVDTSGEGLHKRGYRKASVPAPLKETLAAAMINLSFWNKDRILVDPMCGSGTIAIEAAMIGRNIAPGLNRHFAFEDWELIPDEVISREKKAAYEAIDQSGKLQIYGYDIDDRAIEAAKANADLAGVSEDILFKQMAVKDFRPEGQGGIIITNPPYGERVGEKEKIEKIYMDINALLKEHPDWSCFAVTPDKGFEKKALGRPADRRRKLYNGNIQVCYYQYHGEKPQLTEGGKESGAKSDEK
ncbi:MAG: class I SAM-dependent RNA methyltransferase [Firmicutes bacterium]|nr:class I SAM-dependent RNA methyltransferase [Bacillota bacterium]